jgi:hypothetical protein
MCFGASARAETFLYVVFTACALVSLPFSNDPGTQLIQRCVIPPHRSACAHARAQAGWRDAALREGEFSSNNIGCSPNAGRGAAAAPQQLNLCLCFLSFFFLPDLIIISTGIDRSRDQRVVLCVGTILRALSAPEEGSSFHRALIQRKESTVKGTGKLLAWRRVVFSMRECVAPGVRAFGASQAANNTGSASHDARCQQFHQLYGCTCAMVLHAAREGGEVNAIYCMAGVAPTSCRLRVTARACMRRSHIPTQRKLGDAMGGSRARTSRSRCCLRCLKR